MSEFESLCKLASKENWCWKLSCTTCGGTHFRYAFIELANGNSPLNTNWVINTHKTDYSEQLGGFPKIYSTEQKTAIHKICCEMKISSIASSCRFPDWLGYLGLVLHHMKSDTQSFKELSSTWALQLAKRISPRHSLHQHFLNISNGDGELCISDLERLEHQIIHNWRGLR